MLSDQVILRCFFPFIRIRLGALVRPPNACPDRYQTPDNPDLDCIELGLNPQFCETRGTCYASRVW